MVKTDDDEVNTMSENWIIPCNTKFFDVTEHFKYQDTVVWKNAFTIHKGDTAYIYLGRPYGEIRYKCLVINDSVDEVLLLKNTYAIPAKKSNNYFSKKEKYIQLKYEYEYPAGMLTLAKLKEHGLGQVQIQARTDRRLQQYIYDEEMSLQVNQAGGND